MLASVVIYAIGVLWEPCLLNERSEAASTPIAESCPRQAWGMAPTLPEFVLSVCDPGTGRFILNALRICLELGRDPAAEHLLRNTMRYANRDEAKPVAPLRSGCGELLKTIGYE
jgi:hypothetical protein